MVQLLLIALAIFGVNYARFALGPLQEVMQTALGFSDNYMAVLQGPAIGLPITIGAIPLGHLFSRYPRGRLFSLFTALALAATVLTALSSTFTTLCLARLLIGTAMAAVFVASYSMVGDLYPDDQRGRATMVVTLFEIGAGPAAFALGGAILATGMARFTSFGVTGWRGALLWMCIPLVLIVFFMPAIRDTPTLAPAEVRPPTFLECWRRLWYYRRVALPLLLTRIMVWIADGAVLVWGAPTLARRFALPPERIGAIMATALLVGGVVGPLCGGPLADFCQRTGGPSRTVTALGLLTLAAIPVGLFGIMPNSALVSVAITAFLGIGFMINVVVFALASIVLPDELRGSYFGATFTLAALVGLGLAPLIVSGLAAALGGRAAIGTALALVCGLTSTLGALLFAFSRRYFQKVSGQAALTETSETVGA